MTRWVWESDDLPPGDAVRHLGGKAMGLYRLRRLGLAVPAFVTLTAQAHEAVQTSGGTAVLDEALDRIWRRLGSRAPLAVRSSAVDEDARGLSFAGQHDSVLNVADRAALAAAVARCLASASSARAAGYRAHLAGGREPRMAVVVQEMVVAESAGVVFSADPVGGRPDRMVVSSVFGAGEALVSGTADADEFVCDPAGVELSRRGASPDGRVSSTAAELAEACGAARRVAEDAGTPVDLEFARRGGRTWFLQARPITAGTGRWRLFDNSNIVESYAGLTLPLTFSFIRTAYHGVYVQFAELLGCSAGEIRRRDGMFGEMLALVDGRVYYNLLNWYRLVELMPGAALNRGFMEQMMGVEEKLDAVPGQRALGFFRTLAAGAQMVWLHLTLPRRIAGFHARFRRVHERFAAMDFDAMDIDELIESHRELVAEVLWHWRAPIINDFEAMIFYGVLRRLTVAWGVDPDGALQNNLLCGEGGIVSLAVTEELQELAERIARAPAEAAELAAETPARGLSLLALDPRFAEARRGFHAYLERYGARCVHEMKLEAIPMSEDPTFAFAMLQNYLRHPASRGRARERAGHLRDEAERTVRERLSGPKLALYRWVLASVRRAVANRENQRFARTQAYALVRRIFQSLGRRLAAARALADPRDVFYLEIDEVFAWAGGTATCTDLTGLVSLRKQEYARHAVRTPPARRETCGPVALATARAGAEAGRVPGTPAGRSWRGTGACRGTVLARARVVLAPDPGLRLAGEILVARETDPGWTVLFPSIAGLVVEKGSMLSHSAIVAREMGIPAVVGVRGATHGIADGDLIRLDGATGVVELVEEARAAGSRP